MGLAGREVMVGEAEMAGKVATAQMEVWAEMAEAALFFPQGGYCQ